MNVKGSKFLLSILFFISINAFCQDLIIKKDSSKIFCKVTKEDSLLIFYIPSKGDQKTELSINRTDVLKYHSAYADKKANQAKFDAAEKIYNAKILVKGMYRNYASYITNSPSVVTEVASVERNKTELTLNHGSDYGYSIKGGETINNGDYYGFCDGKDVFINYDHPKGYCKLEYIGPYSFFNYIVHAIGLLALVPDQLMIIDENGKFIDGTVKNIKKILKEKNPELSHKYEAEEKSKEKRREYLIQLNKYLTAKK